MGLARRSLFGVFALMAAWLAASPGQEGLTLPVLVDPGGQQIYGAADPSVDGGSEGLVLKMEAEDGLADLEDYPTVEVASLPELSRAADERPADGELAVASLPLPVDRGEEDPLAGDLVMPVGAADGVVPFEGRGIDEAVEEGQRNRGKFRFSLGGRVIYDDNIFISAREEVEDVLYIISPGISIHLGDSLERERSYLYLNYNPEAVFFQETSEENAVDQNLEVGGAWKGAKLSIAATAGYQNLHGSTVDAGDRTDRQVFYGNAVLGYGWGGKTSIETGFYYEQSDYDELSDTRELRNETFIDYQWTDKTSLGLGGGIGRLELLGTDGGDQDFQQVLLRGRSQVGAKLALHGRAGADFRQSEAGESVTPIFGLGAEYEPLSGMLVTLDTSRDISASASEDGEVYIRTAAEFGVSQRFLRRWKLGLDGGVEKLDYEAVAAAGDGEREETGFFVKPSIRYDFKENLNGELFYLLRDNDSNDAEQSYSNNQIGISVGIDF